MLAPYFPMPADTSRNDTVLRTLAFTAEEDLLVLCHTSAPPADEEWETWLVREARREHKGILITTDGGAPNSRQRARVAEATGGKGKPRPGVALLTDSAVVRSVMTAFAWILGQEHPMRAFPRAAIDEAVVWLRVRAEPVRARAAVARLRAALSLPPIAQGKKSMP
jgi:hypothetical protein